MVCNVEDAEHEILVADMSLSVHAFDKFDEDGSGLMGRDEFAKAMHTLGLRLTAAEYDILFDEYDEDKSGEIDLVSARPARVGTGI